MTLGEKDNRRSNHIDESARRGAYIDTANGEGRDHEPADRKRWPT